MNVEQICKGDGRRWKKYMKKKASKKLRLSGKRLEDGLTKHKFRGWSM